MTASGPGVSDMNVVPLYGYGDEPVGVGVSFLDVTKYRQLRDELERSNHGLDIGLPAAEVVPLLQRTLAGHPARSGVLVEATNPQRAVGAADRRAAHSSRPAWTKAWGRLPRSWRWCTSYSSVYRPAGPHAARLRSNQRAASAGSP